MTTLRHEVQVFAAAMERKLRENDYKGGWRHMAPKWLLKRLRQEVKELERRLAEKTAKPKEIASEAADVANFAMMIADTAGELEEDA